MQLPEEYKSLDNETLKQRIIERKKELGDDLCILGHHYQRDEIIELVDLTGDSLKLSQLASEQAARYIVFCGVHFMAESADILTSDQQAVCLPNIEAGCEMANMADDFDVSKAIEHINSVSPEAKTIPISYVNSTAAIKSITGANGGACCTSSNVANVFKWALASEADGGAGADKLLCVPDQHLARNTAVALGYSLDDCIVYDPHKLNGGLTDQQIKDAKFILWKGHCYVHQIFRADDIAKVREKYPNIQVIVHPECPYEVVQLADAYGSTQQIIKAVAETPAGTKWAIGTESSLVNRLANRHPDQFIVVLNEFEAKCRSMQKTRLNNLLWTLDNLAQGNIINQVSVDPQQAQNAKLALQRMVNIKGVADITKK